MSDSSVILVKNDQWKRFCTETKYFCNVNAKEISFFLGGSCVHRGGSSGVPPNFGPDLC